MASSSGVESRRSASGGYYRSSPSPFASSSSTFSARSSTFRSSSPNRVAMNGKSSSSLSSSSSAAAASVRFQIDRGSSTSPGRSISVQKARENANAVSSNKKKVCMCSPTTHPGSFRCSLHKNSTFSVGAANRRQFQNGAFGSSSTLNFRRSAMTNSLVRIGVVEGGDLVRRALSALIRPSSNQQRRQLAFQPRPSRLSVMSRAEED
ncbi:uncharacterized protein LOC111020980 [Momordica charantia]|uniref:Uncharacterized protein LOC111020980 n=1 Tax=Momordica charantia TaxID=3673 RepID=A0A6J1DHK6_MOMCH|nr:uncharacterized protein LOC111020980 [Momordica charantia]